MKIINFVSSPNEVQSWSIIQAREFETAAPMILIDTFGISGEKFAK